MDLAGSGLSATLSSSCMPFLKALMPCATSPIRSEILPRPNSSRTTAITTIQCQMLSEPILQPSKHAAGDPAQSDAETRRRRCQKQGLRPRQIGVNGTTVNRMPDRLRRAELAILAAALRLHRRGQRQFEITDLQRILVIAQGRVI